MTRTRSAFLLASVLILGFFLRVWGLDFGLPQLVHADEPIVVNHALAFGLGDFNPHFFNIPPLTSYLLFFATGVFYVVGWIQGIFSDPQAFLEAFLINPTLYIIQIESKPKKTPIQSRPNK